MPNENKANLLRLPISRQQELYLISVIILAGEVLAAVESFLERDIHHTVIFNAYFKGLDDIVELTKSIGKT